MERRGEIIDATLELLGRYGLEGTTVARIASAVGLTPGALYQHFESRAALIDEANKVAGERAANWVEMSNDTGHAPAAGRIGEQHTPRGRRETLAPLFARSFWMGSRPLNSPIRRAR